jgi:uncharacterized protein YdiU (UPF0061 family)
MSLMVKQTAHRKLDSFEQFAETVEYSLLERLNADPSATEDGDDHRARQVFSGHYVPVKPTPIADAKYVAHSHAFFEELGLADELVKDEQFQRLFSGDMSEVKPPMRPYGWATGYALSIYGTEYTHQCPFGTGNGYGDGRAVSVFEGVLNGQRWEMQLKGGGQTPYCRGADGRAVLRSSVREFLAQEYMYALGVPTSRSLTLFASPSETVTRPWYSENSHSFDPDILVKNPVAISTRVAPSFLRVGQVELFARRTRKNAHDQALEELRLIVTHLIEREYQTEIDSSLSFEQQIVELARLFRGRLTSLVANWLRVGYCQGNFNSDNCAAGGFTLDYGPFGFCEVFDPDFQPWTGGGQHFSFFNQPAAAEANFHMFWSALRHLLVDNADALSALDDIRRGFTDVMQAAIQTMWAAKLGTSEYHADLVKNLLPLLSRSEVDYTLFFRELCKLPQDVSGIESSFYVTVAEGVRDAWNDWLKQWHTHLQREDNLDDVAARMKRTNPKYTWREWLVVPAYQQAMSGDYSLIEELQNVFSAPYDEQSAEIEAKYYRLKPKEFLSAGGVSHYSCSS